MVNNLVIYDGIPDDVGWLPVKHMIRLFTELFELEIITSSGVSLNKIQKGVHLLGRYWKPVHKASTNVLIVVPTLDVLDKALFDLLRHRYNKVAVWVFDSFWTSRVSAFYSKHWIDHLFVTSGHDVSVYRDMIGVECSFLGWGADVLRLGGRNDRRTIDILRLGRQPDCFDNDKTNDDFFASVGLKYQGRPNLDLAYGDLFADYFLKTKYVLAHSNLADSSAYTHPEKEYITARWTDPLACGCIIIGKQPVTDYAFERYLWPQAVVDIDLPERIDRLDVDAFRLSWSSDTALYNYKMALERLDWRWRFKDIADYFGINCARLHSEIDEIEQIMNSLETRR